MTLLARLKPYNEKRNQLTRTYMIDGARFYVDRGWYEVPDALGEKLRDLHQDHYDPDSPFLFDVGTPEEAQAIEDRETRQAEEALRATARNPAILGEGRRRSTAIAAANAQKLSNQGEPGRGGDVTTAEFSGGQRPKVRPTEPGPITNAGEPGGGGDMTTQEFRGDGTGTTLQDPDPEGKELLENDDGRATEVGRVGNLAGAAGASTGPKSRAKR